MGVPAEAELQQMVRVEFPSQNLTAYTHDHGFYRGIPSGNWWIGGIHGEWIELVRPGYGTKEKYGSGSIAIAITDLSAEAKARKKTELAAEEDRILAKAAAIAKRRAPPSLPKGDQT